MPVIHVHMFEGRTLDQKRKLVAAMTEAVVKSLDAKRKRFKSLSMKIPGATCPRPGCCIRTRNNAM